MKLLALDTATEACSVALMIDGQLLSRYDVAGRSHTARLPSMLQSVMAEAGLSYAQLDGYVCGVGPGSFAGVRIGVGFIKGLALAHERPVVAVSSLQMLALPALDAGAARVLTAIDARMDEVYFAAWSRSDNGLPQMLTPAQVAAPAQIGPHAGAWHAAGSGWQSYADVLRAATGATLETVDGAALPRAADALRIARPRFVAGDIISAADLLPDYLRNKVALTMREQAARRPAQS